MEPFQGIAFPFIFHSLYFSSFSFQKISVRETNVFYKQLLFFKTHRRELIEFLAKHKKIFVVCKMNESADISKNITFINANISDASLNIFKIFKILLKHLKNS